MNCPICNNKMPFGLQIHLVAAHGSEQLKQQLRSAEEGNEASARSIQRQLARTRQVELLRKNGECPGPQSYHRAGVNLV